jgi:curved DNA-binding protein
MTAAEPFVDYYAVLRVDPRCDAKTLASAYHELVKSYHPDYAETPDAAKLNDVVQAYRALRYSKGRAEYDAMYAQYNADYIAEKLRPGDEAIDETTALEDARDHDRILMHLYKKRREDAQNADVVGYYLQEMLGCSDQHFEFHKWYLREKGFIAITEHGTVAITIAGIDHVISTCLTTRAQRLLIEKSANLQD